MKKLLLLVVVSLIGFVSHATTRVYFSSNWSVVNAYAWNDETGNNAGWPGVSIKGNTANIGGTTYYYFEFDETKNNYAAVIFNAGSGSSQTKDLAIVDGIVYENSTTSTTPIGIIRNSELIPYSTYKNESAKIYFKADNYNVEKACLYTWTPEIAGSWNDHTELTKETIDGNSYWSYTTTVGNLFAIFGGLQLNTGNSSNQKEIKDKAVGPGTVINIEKGLAGTIKAEPTYPDNIYLIGSLPGSNWDPANALELTNNGKGIYTISNVNISGGNAASFSFISQKNSDWAKTWPRYGAGSGYGTDKSFTSGVQMDLYQNNGDVGAFNGEAGIYNITVDLANMKMTATLVKKVYPDNLYIIKTENGDWNYKSGVNLAGTEGVYTGKLTVDDGNTHLFFATEVKSTASAWNDYSGVRLVPSSNGDVKVNLDMSNRTLNGNIANGDSGSYLIINKGEYNVTVDIINNTVTFELIVEYPKEMYIYGHLNDLAWDINNYVPMEAGNTPGVFTAKNVEISGRWNEFDASGDDSREEFESTGNENYISFFPQVIENQSLFGSTPKFTTILENENELISITENNTIASADLKYGTSDFNFHVPEGFYNITVDLTNMTVTFEKFKKEDVVFTWYQGGHGDYETASILEDQDNHGFTFGDGNPDILQVGIGTNPTHRVARMVKYEVWYKAPGESTSAKAVKRFADENQTNYKELGYNEAVPTSEDPENGDYTIIGSSDYGDNHLIQLNKAGDYAIIASVDTGKDPRLAAYNDVPDNTLLVSVAQAEADVSFQNQTAPFPAEKDFATLEEALQFDQNLVLGKDFTISIKAQNNADGWEKPSNKQDLDASYKAALTEDLYNQLKDLGGISVKVDGFYFEDQVNVDAASNGDYAYDVKVGVPCSGVYEVTVSPVANGNYTFDAITSNVSIYPNLQAKFGDKEYGFNVNFYVCKDVVDGIQVIHYPEDAEDLENCPAYIPGSYFVSYLSTEKYGTQAIADGVNDYRDKYKDFCYLDLSDIPTLGEQGKNVEITVSKNGATGTHVFSVVASNEGNYSTGIESVDAANDGEAVYYNLQGVKVNNPGNGVYIRVANGKATKVLVSNK